MNTPPREYELWLNSLTLAQISVRLRDLGCVNAFLKILVANNNSKQQIYVGSDLVQITKLPMQQPVQLSNFSGPEKQKDKVRFQCRVELKWLNRESESVAPQAKFIYYPQYPEVRLSGFLADCDDPPSFLLNVEQRGHDYGRVLILAPTRLGTIYGLVLPPESLAAKEIAQREYLKYGVFSDWNLNEEGQPHSSPTFGSSFSHSSTIPETRQVIAGEEYGRDQLFGEICKIANRGFLDSVRLNSEGNLLPYAAQNGCGYTLEAHLGIANNGRSQPDLFGWEIKSHTVKTFATRNHGVITMFTPEPDGGQYCELGAAEFLKKYGYGAIQNSQRLNFSSIHKVPSGVNPKTGLSLKIFGYELGGKINQSGKILLADSDGNVAASWSFEKLLAHWMRKHSNAIYVPATKRLNPNIQYSFGADTYIGVGTNFVLLLDSIARGEVYYDPGLNLKVSPSGQLEVKKRNQFRVNFNHLYQLYENFSQVNVCTSLLG